MHVYQCVRISGTLFDEGKAHYNLKLVNYEEVLIYKHSKFVGSPHFL